VSVIVMNRHMNENENRNGMGTCTYSHCEPHNVGKTHHENNENIPH
jgi:hypothetical protein